MCCEFDQISEGTSSEPRTFPVDSASLAAALGTFEVAAPAAFARPDPGDMMPAHQHTRQIKAIPVQVEWPAPVFPSGPNGVDPLADKVFQQHDLHTSAGAGRKSHKVSSPLCLPKCSAEAPDPSACPTILALCAAELRGLSPRKSGRIRKGGPQRTSKRIAWMVTLCYIRSFQVLVTCSMASCIC